MLKLFNTLHNTKEEFKPIDSNNIGMYICGPTVYDKVHIGNGRAFVIYDILYRLLCEIYKKEHVTYVRNITDIDDKINKRAKEKGITIQSLTKEMIKAFHEDIEALNTLPPNIEPKATEYIEQIKKFIQLLIDNGNAYVAEGHVLFDVTSFSEYGKLSNRSLDEMISGARVEIAPYKRNPMDFVLWKPALAIDDESSIFDSPWSKGRPGWHIECSVMSKETLGETFDIHAGGEDLKFPHHENEIAQSKCAHKNSEYARYWLHNGFLMVEGQKMSKSLGNFTTIRDLLDKGISGAVIRYTILKTHYRKPLDFTQSSLKEAEKVLKDLHKDLENINSSKEIPIEILNALKDDINTPKAFAELHTLKSKPEQLKSALEFLGLYDKSFFIKKENKLQIPESEIKQLIQERSEAKKNKDWKKADEIRNYLLEKGIVLKDNPDGTTTWEI